MDILCVFCKKGVCILSDCPCIKRADPGIECSSFRPMEINDKKFKKGIDR